MPVLEARTTVHRPAETVFDALLDLRRYEPYSTYLTAVEREGDGGVGTEYELRFAWWRVGFTVHMRVTAVERPTRLDFEVLEGVSAHGSWVVNPGTGADADEPVTEVRFVAEYDPETVADGSLDLPALASRSWVVDRVAPLVEREARRVVQQVVQDLEGGERPVELEVTIR